jgi:hypothetical protein
MGLSVISLLLMLALLLPLGRSSFSIDTSGVGGTPLKTTACNVQTIIDFLFNSTTVTSGWTSGGAGTVVRCVFMQANADRSSLIFLDRYGNEFTAPLTSFSFTRNGAMTGFVTGYSTTPATVAVFQFVSGINNVYVWVPFITSTPTGVDVIDLTSTLAPANAIESFNGDGALSAFNLFDKTDFNLWYALTSGTNTVLASRFVYRITSVSNANAALAGAASNLDGVGFSDAIAYATGEKLCYASRSNGNVPQY